MSDIDVPSDQRGLVLGDVILFDLIGSHFSLRLVSLCIPRGTMATHKFRHSKFYYCIVITGSDVYIRTEDAPHPTSRLYWLIGDLIYQHVSIRHIVVCVELIDAS